MSPAEEERRSRLWAAMARFNQIDALLPDVADFKQALAEGDAAKVAEVEMVMAEMEKVSAEIEAVIDQQGGGSLIAFCSRWRPRASGAPGVGRLLMGRGIAH